MATLTGKQIENTYPGLLKTSDESVLDATTEKTIEDGEGNASTLTMSQTSASFSGTLDLSAASVNGLPEPGLVNGTGSGSLQSADNLTAAPANASGDNAIAIGNGALADKTNGIAIGNGTVSNHGVAIGTNVNTFAFGNSLAIGNQSKALGNESAALGFSACATATRSIAIGNSNATSTGSISIGHASNVNALNAVALGCGVTATKADTVTVKEIETCVPGGGLTLTTPDGLNQPKLTVNDSEELLIAGNPVGGGGGAAGLVSGTGTDSMQSDASLTTVAADAAAECSIAIGNGACATEDMSIAIGNSACATSLARNSVTIGNCASVFGSNGVSIGEQSFASGLNAIAIGRNACTTSSNGIAMGINSRSNNDGFAIGGSSSAIVDFSIALGRVSKATAICSIAIGRSACANANSAVALGAFVTAAKDDTVTVRALETCVAGEGVIMTTPDGLNQYKVTVDNSGNLVTTIV